MTTSSLRLLLFTACLAHSLIACRPLFAQSAPQPVQPPANTASPAPQPAQPAASTAPPAPANVPGQPAVEVLSHDNQLQVKVPDQAPLSTVLSSVCQQQKIKCTGTETLTSYRGPAMTVDGTLRQVISKLLEGTDVNYEFSRSAEGSATEISFLGHAPRGAAAVPSATTQEKPDHPTVLHSRPFPGPPQPNVPQTTSPQSSPPQSQLRPIAPSSKTAVESVGSTPQAENGSAATLLFTGTGDSTPAQYQPFPDQNGQPIPIDNTPATTLPFTDQHGNPIPVKPATGGSPFPAKPSGDAKQ